MPFFFSSRRRHTRSKRDWSSDVCSSDLFQRVGQRGRRARRADRRAGNAANLYIAREIGRASCREREYKFARGGTHKKKIAVRGRHGLASRGGPDEDVTGEVVHAWRDGYA